MTLKKFVSGGEMALDYVVTGIVGVCFGGFAGGLCGLCCVAPGLCLLAGYGDLDSCDRGGDLAKYGALGSVVVGGLVGTIAMFYMEPPQKSQK